MLVQPLQHAGPQSTSLNKTSIHSDQSIRLGQLPLYPLVAAPPPSPTHSNFLLQQSAMIVLEFLAGIQAQPATIAPSPPPLGLQLPPSPSTSVPNLAPSISSPLPNSWAPTACANAQPTTAGQPSSPPSPFYNTLATSPFPLSYPPKAVHSIPQSLPPPLHSNSPSVRCTISEPTLKSTSCSPPTNLPQDPLSSHSWDLNLTRSKPPKPLDPHLHALSSLVQQPLPLAGPTPLAGPLNTNPPLLPNPSSLPFTSTWSKPILHSFASSSFKPPSSLILPSWVEGDPCLEIPQAMEEEGLKSFQYAAMGRFVGARHTLEWLEL